MTVITVDESKLKDAVKAAIMELLEERRDLLDDWLAEALADTGLGYAIREGEKTAPVSRDAVVAILEARA